MDLEQRLHENLVAPDPGTEFTAAVMARVKDHASARRHGAAATGAARGRHRWLSRLLSVGIVTAAGVTAAMLAERLARVPERPVAQAVSAPAAIAAATNTVATARVSATVQPAETVVETVRSTQAPSPSPSPPPGGSSQPADASTRYVVLLMPLRQESGDAAARGPVESFYAAALHELRKVPGLTLLVQDDTSSSTAQRSDYVVTLTGIATPEVGVAMVQIEARAVFGSRFRPMAIATRAHLAEGALGGSPSESAAQTVQWLRERVFPSQ